MPVPQVRDVVRRYPRIREPAALPLFCLAPHGVFRASRIAPRAVSSYLAFSPLPELFSKNRRYVFCDTFRQRPLSRMLPACFTRHAAVWCSDFPPASPAYAGFTSDHLPSARSLTQRREKKTESNKDSGGVLVTGTFLLTAPKGFCPVGEEKFFLGWKKPVGCSNDWPQCRHHLQTNHNENSAPKLQMIAAGTAEQMAHSIEQTQAKHDSDRPESDVQRSHESNRIG
jgi:hypothetical protein